MTSDNDFTGNDVISAFNQSPTLIEDIYKHRAKAQTDFISFLISSLSSSLPPV